MGDIEMMDSGATPLSHSSRESTVQSGGSSGSIEMLGGAGVTLSHTPVSSVQVGGKLDGDWVGPTDLINRGAHDSAYGSEFPKDRGE